MRIDEALAQIGEIVTPASTMPQLGELLTTVGTDGWRYGGSAYASADWVVDVFALRLFGSGGIDDFRTPSTMYRSENARASVMPGLHLQAGKLDIKLFAGADYMIRIPLRPASDAPVQKIGARATLDSWWEPAENWMLSGSISATTIETGVSGRIASGWRLFSAWIGPEAIAIRDIYSTQVRAGAHVSGFRVGMTEWSLAGGYVRDSFGRSSPYGRIGLTLRP